MKQRYALLDTIRGFTIISMVLYHMTWDMVYMFHIPLEWFKGTGAFLWQQSICWSFIFISGFCWRFSKNPMKRGMITLVCGAVISLFTSLFMPESKIVFGILTLLGSCMLLMIPAEKIFRKLPVKAGALVSGILFLFLLPINKGYLGFGEWKVIQPVSTLYQGMAATYVGFTDKSFYSSDYFSLIPWCFLFFFGYFAYRISKIEQRNTGIFYKQIRPISAVGRHSLLIYLLHQPVIYLILKIILG